MSLNDVVGHVEIPLLRGGFVLVDSAYAKLVGQFRWRSWTPNGGRTSYAVSGGGNTRLVMHRFLTNAPTGMRVDHINGNGLDNRRSNLRLVGASENATNVRELRSDNRTGYRGVSFHAASGLWLARLQSHGKVRAKYAKTAEEAAVLYDEMVREHHGPIAYLNFPAK